MIANPVYILHMGLIPTEVQQELVPGSTWQLAKLGITFLANPAHFACFPYGTHSYGGSTGACTRQYHGLRLSLREGSSLHILIVLEPHPGYEDLGSDCGSQRVPLQRYNLRVTS